MDIFEVEGGKIRISPNVLLIPALKAVHDAYEDPVPALSYVHFLTHPFSPYGNVPDSEKQEMISDAVGGDFGLEDEVIEDAIAYCKKLYMTPIQEYYEGQKNSMIVIGRVLKNLTEDSVVAGRDGNLDQIIRMQKEAGSTIKSFIALEKLWTEQAQQKLRGNAELGEY